MDETDLKLVFLCSPNNPTGNVVAPADIVRIADGLSKAIIVLDEAYIEFADVESLAVEATKRVLNLHVERAILATIDFAMSQESESFDTDDLRANVDRFLKR